LNDWLQQMPSNRYEAEFTYQIDKEHQQDHYITFNLMHVEQQSRVPANRKDYLPPPPAYTLVNIESGTMFHLFEKRIDLSLGVRNLLNTTYREYMNRFRYFNDEAGRNIVLRLKYQL
jgi:iron complex outermembrane receptor protein